VFDCFGVVVDDVSMRRCVLQRIPREDGGRRKMVDMAVDVADGCWRISVERRKRKKQVGWEVHGCHSSQAPFLGE